MGEKKLVVLFPGVNYTTDCPLLYYAAFVYESRDYEKIMITYGDAVKKNKKYYECLDDIKKVVLKQLKTINFSEYEDIVFVSKSMGTVIAGWLEESLSVGVKHIYLTPVKETLPYIKKDKNIIAVVAGTKDQHMDIDVLKEICEKEKVYLKQIEGAGHRLEIKEDINKTIEIVKDVAALY